MAEVEFADGFDIAEPLLWRLTPGQLGTIAASAAVAYLAVRSPLPLAARAILATVVGGAALTLALVRREGRTLLSWLGTAASFWARPRRGLMLVVDGNSDGAARGGECPPACSSGLTAETPRRIPLVVLPEPRAADARGQRADGDRWDPFSPTVPRQPACRRVTFFSLAGGSGRTTLAVEVAGLLAAPGVDEIPGGRSQAPMVALVDCDLMSPRAGLRLGLPLATAWSETLETETGEIALDRLGSAHRSGVWAVPGPARVPIARWTLGRASVEAIASLVAALERRGCDVIVLDIPAGLGPISRWAVQSAHDVFVVVTATAGGIQDAYRSTEALRRLGLGHKLHHVVNHGHGEPMFTECMGDLGSVVVAEIPDDPALERAEADHRLLGTGCGSTAAALRTLAAVVDSRIAGEAGGARGSRRLIRRQAS
ncbi:MAG TPA: ParA family protein [Candidatus Binatia bacterium]|nr:ParA family protein [Candidatus Binatia bacterium]